jgi:hypothetical protein
MLASMSIVLLQAATSQVIFIHLSDTSFELSPRCVVDSLSAPACHRVVQDHVSVSHSGGKSILLDSPEEIERWREARRQNWPSKENLKRKLEQRQGKETRGELLPNETRTARHKSAHAWQIRSTPPVSSVPSKDFGKQKDLIQQSVDDKSSPNLLSSLLDYSSDSSGTPAAESESDKISLEDSAPPMRISSRPDVSIGPSRIESESARNEKRTPESKDDGRSKKRICKFFANGHCSKGKWCKFIHEKPGAPASQSGDNYQYHGSVHRRGPCLLEKLLSSEQDQDTSRILQCLRHLVISGQVA